MKEIRTTKVEVSKDVWRTFVAMCKMSGMTVQEAIGMYISDQVKTWESNAPKKFSSLG